MELLLPPDPTAQYSAARLQLIAGAGGLEAAMFTRDLFTMYAAYARHRGWRLASDDDCGATETAVGADGPIHHLEVRVDSSDPTDPVYPCLRWEAGVHRVQRVPLTSKLNKIHTSTVAVTVLPVIDEVGDLFYFSSNVDSESIDRRADCRSCGGLVIPMHLSVRNKYGRLLTKLLCLNSPMRPLLAVVCLHGNA